MYHSIFRPDLFDGQTIIVTGGGSGIGRAVAHELAGLGAHVVIASRRTTKLERIQAEIVEAGGSASHYQCNLREEEQIIDLFGRCWPSGARFTGWSTTRRPISQPGRAVDQ
jgi:NAD(P)-dependent dehydrogenase (short-subunit alcohol dehydrogenase family)